MKKSVPLDSLFHLIVILIQLSLVNCSPSCSIFVSLNCSCFQSEVDLHSSLPNPTYSHLYCQGNLARKRRFTFIWASDLQYQNRFRTVSIELFSEDQLEIQSNQFDSLSLLFSRTNVDAEIEISIRFTGFTQLILRKYSLTSKMFHEKHSNKHLQLTFLPRPVTNSTQIETDEENLKNIEEEIKFGRNCFSGLNVSELNIYIHSNENRLITSSPFEFVFNNTNIGELHFHGSIILPDSSSFRQTFVGLIRSLTIHRRVDTIDSNTFPYYFSVNSYTIHSIAAHSMDLRSFVSLFNNLRGLEIINPRFEVCIDEYIPTLDSLTLDIEYLNERTFWFGKHVHHLKLGSRLRRIDPQVFHSFPNHLKHFDMSQINLSEMPSDSRCYLIHFISHIYRRQFHLILPRIEYLSECDCARLFLDNIQLLRQSPGNVHQQDLSCSKQCRFSDCPTLSEYFRTKSPLFVHENVEVLNSDGLNGGLPSVDLFADQLDVDTISFLINQTNDEQIPPDERRTTKFVLHNKNDSKTRILLPIELDESIKTTNANQRRRIDLSKSQEKDFSSWILIGIVLFLIFIFIIIILTFVIVKHRQRKHLKRVPVYI